MPKGLSLRKTNYWWREDKKTDVAKNFTLRFVFGFYKMLQTLKDYTVIITIVLGVFLLLLAFWLNHTSEKEQANVRKPLIGTDDFIDDVVDGLNYMTQEFPNRAVNFLNTTVFAMQDVADSFGKNTVNKMLLPLNGMTAGIQNTVNELVRWAYKIANRPGNPPQITIPAVTANIPTISNSWAPPLQYVNLSEIEIPSRKFSVDRELYPFVVKVFDIPRTVAYYATWIGSIMLAYAGLRLLLAFIIPFIPRVEIMCCGKNFTTCLKVTGQSGKEFTKALAKPWLHVPITVGICLVLLVVLFLNPRVTQLHHEIQSPLQVADNATAEFISEINNLIETLPQKLVDSVNNQFSIIEGHLASVLDNSIIKSVFPDINKAITSVNTVVNNFLLDTLNTDNGVYIPTIPYSTGGYNLPSHFMSRIPYIPTDEMLIPLDLVSLQKPISPWVDERISDMRTVSANILAAGIGLIVIPGAAVLWAAGKPIFSHMLPKHIKDFFTNPDFYDDDVTVDEANVMLEDDENKV